MATFLYRVGRWCADHVKTVIAAWLIVLAALGGGAATFGTSPTPEVTIPGSTFQNVLDHAATQIPEVAGGFGTVVVHSRDGAFTDTQKAALTHTFDEWTDLDQVNRVVDPFAAQAQLDANKSKLADAATQLDSADAQLTAGRTELDTAKFQLLQGQGLLDHSRGEGPGRPRHPLPRAATRHRPGATRRRRGPVAGRLRPVPRGADRLPAGRGHGCSHQRPAHGLVRRQHGHCPDPVRPQYQLGRSSGARAGAGDREHLGGLRYGHRLQRGDHPGQQPRRCRRDRRSRPGRHRARGHARHPDRRRPPARGRHDRRRGRPGRGHGAHRLLRDELDDPGPGPHARPGRRHRLRPLHRQPPPQPTAAGHGPQGVDRPRGRHLGQRGALRGDHRRHRPRRPGPLRHPAPGPDGSGRRRDRRRGGARGAHLLPCPPSHHGHPGRLASWMASGRIHHPGRGLDPRRHRGPARGGARRLVCPAHHPPTLADRPRCGRPRRHHRLPGARPPSRTPRRRQRAGRLDGLPGVCRDPRRPSGPA
jgi:hypothetical protein